MIESDRVYEVGRTVHEAVVYGVTAMSRVVNVETGVNRSRSMCGEYDGEDGGVGVNMHAV